MQKESIAWLIIRTCGLFFFAVFACKIFYFLANIVFILSYQPPATLPFDTLRLPALNWRPLTEALLSLGCSVYFLRFGKLAHRWLTREI